jgi:hypothetical protein
VRLYYQLLHKQTHPKKGFKVAALENRYKEHIKYGDVPVDFKLLSTDIFMMPKLFLAMN